MRVYLSYAQPDADAAHALADALRSDGLAVWDDTLVVPGEHWGQASATAIKRADAFVVLLSDESVDSPWVRNEIQYALGASRFEDRVVPVYLDDVRAPAWPLEALVGVRGRSTETWAKVSTIVKGMLQTPSRAASG